MLPVDYDPSSESNAIIDGRTVTVSPIQGTYQASTEATATILTQMRSLFDSVPTIATLKSAPTVSTLTLSATAPVVVAPKLINISMRGFVGTGANVQIAGFIISGQT